jgi:hypothetical protein
MKLRNLYQTTLMLLLSVSFAYAQNVSVIIAVDMSNETVSADGVHIAGDLQDDFTGTSCGEWDPACTMLSQGDSANIYLIKMELPAGTYQYKFVNGNAWGSDEGSGLNADCGVDDGFGNFNRGLDLTNAPTGVDTVVGPYVFNSCEISGTEVTSVEDRFSETVNLTVAPNPVVSSFTVSFENASRSQFNISLMNLNGQTVMQRSAVNSNEVTFDRGDLSAGVYFLRLQNQEGRQVTKKVVLN